MIEAIVGLIAGPVGSGITGLIGGWLSKREERKLTIAQLDHDKEVMQFQIESQKLEMTHAIELADKQMEIAQVEGEIEADIKEMDVMLETVKAQSKPTIPFVDAILKFVRPAITIYVLYLFSRTSADIHLLSGGLENLDKATLEELLVGLVTGLISLTFLVVGWWFGSRGGNLLKK